MRFIEYYKVTEEVEFLDIELEGDYPFFIDPLLLKNSIELNGSYEKFLNYFKGENLNYSFKEIKETHLGFGYLTNSGHGIGKKLGRSIKDNVYLNKYNYDLDTIEIFGKGIGIDMISDMTANIILEDLLKFTERMCQKYNINTQEVSVEIYVSNVQKFNLPVYREEYIILVPKDILRKDSLLLSRSSFIHNIFTVVETLENTEMKSRLDNILHKEVFIKSRNRKEKKPISKKDIIKLMDTIIDLEPDIINKYKEYIESLNPSTNITENEINQQSENILRLEEIIDNLKNEFIENSKEKNFRDSVREVINFYKNEIENSDLIKLFEHKRNKSEGTHQKIFRTVAKKKDIGLNSEVNNGNGPVDFKCIKNNEECLIEFKLMSNSKSKNVYKQVETYFKVNDAKYCFVVLFIYSDEELERAEELSKQNTNKNIETIVINCDSSKYVSASNKK